MKYLILAMLIVGCGKEKTTESVASITTLEIDPELTFDSTTDIHEMTGIWFQNNLDDFKGDLPETIPLYEGCVVPDEDGQVNVVKMVVEKGANVESLNGIRFDEIPKGKKLVFEFRYEDVEER